MSLDVPWSESWYLYLFGFKFGKLGWSLSRKWHLAYMVANLINEKVEFVPWFKTWFVILFGFVFGKMKVLKCPLLRKCDFSLYDYMFDKYESWACPSMSLGVKHGICTYLVLNLVNKRYWDDPCRENEILAYMLTCLINIKVELVPRCPLKWSMIVVPIWF